MTGRHLHIDCFSGLAGDMMLAALIDLGVPVTVVTDALRAIGLGDITLSFAEVTRATLRGKYLRAQRGATVITGGEPHAHEHPDHAPAHDHHDHDHGHHDHDHAHGPHHHWREIRARLEHGLTGETQRLALAIFTRLAEAEAARHGVAIDDVAFHEVGALDSLLDVVGVAAALAWLAPSTITVRTIPLGHGRVRTAHGLLPIPAPATLALLTGFAVEDGGVAMELTTPTGAAIVAACGATSAEFPRGTPRATGWGAGTKDVADRPNLLRLVALDPVATDVPAPSLWQLEANLDDLNPQLAAALVDALLAVGCKDAWLTPIVMKKGRPGVVIAALVDEAHRAAAELALFRNSTTIGLRRTPVTRHELTRTLVTLDSPFGPVRVKVATDGDVVRNATLEYEDVVTLAATHGMTVKELYHLLEPLLGSLRQSPQNR